jgi:sterol desaturase/sphingolipid hydroxylase (fatty acid hydroxylase superfamily)
MPIVLYCLYQAYQIGISPLYIPLFYIGGGLFWTLAEYLLHRFVFHYHATTKIGKRISFLTHGVHHDYPNDSKRLVMPPILGVPIALVFWLLFTLILGSTNVYPFFAGFISGYLVYDMMHYALHHANIKHPLFLKLKQHHMIHHYAEPENGFGVSSTFWDTVFKTELQKNKK